MKVFNKPEALFSVVVAVLSIVMAIFVLFGYKPSDFNVIATYFVLALAFSKIAINDIKN